MMGLSSQVSSGLRWKHDALTRSTGVRAPVRVQWLGTAGFAIEHDGHTVLIDPYVTRASLLRCGMGALRPDLDAIALYTPRADAIVLGHTHFDHALDAPSIARNTGARVFGSTSAVNLCKREGVAAVENMEEACRHGEAVREVGPFVLRFLPSAHSALALGRIPFPGEISDCDQVPMPLHHYKCGAVFGVQIEVAGVTLFHLGSANLVEASIPQRSVDLLMMCVAGWTTTRNFPSRVMKNFAPRAVLLSHWDNFFSPMRSVLKELPAMRIGSLVDQLTAQSRTTPVGTLDLMGEVWL